MFAVPFFYCGSWAEPRLFFFLVAITRCSFCSALLGFLKALPGAIVFSCSNTLLRWIDHIHLSSTIQRIVYEKDDYTKKKLWGVQHTHLRGKKDQRTLQRASSTYMHQYLLHSWARSNCYHSMSSRCGKKIHTVASQSGVGNDRRQTKLTQNKAADTSWPEDQQKV